MKQESNRGKGRGRFDSYSRDPNISTEQKLYQILTFNGIVELPHEAGKVSGITPEQVAIYHRTLVERISPHISKPLSDLERVCMRLGGVKINIPYNISPPAQEYHGERDTGGLCGRHLPLAGDRINTRTLCYLVGTTVVTNKVTRDGTRTTTLTYLKGQRDEQLVSAYRRMYRQDPVTTTKAGGKR